MPITFTDEKSARDYATEMHGKGYSTSYRKVGEDKWRVEISGGLVEPTTSMKEEERISKIMEEESSKIREEQTRASFREPYEISREQHEFEKSKRKREYDLSHPQSEYEIRREAELARRKEGLSKQLTTKERLGQVAKTTAESPVVQGTQVASGILSHTGRQIHVRGSMKRAIPTTEGRHPRILMTETPAIANIERPSIAKIGKPRISETRGINKELTSGTVGINTHKVPKLIGKTKIVVEPREIHTPRLSL